MWFRRTFFLLLFTLTCNILRAEEPVLEFISGLRSRGYHDTALQYLDQVSAQQNLPAEIRVVLPYERAQILLEGASDLNNRDAKRKQLDAAQASLEEFVKASPAHPLAGNANTNRGEILVQKATVEIWEADTPSNEGVKEKFRDQARILLGQARRIFEQARDQHKTSWEAFPTFISEEDQVQRAARDAASDQFMKAQLDLAQVTYFEAQTYDRGSAQRNEALTKAALEFEDIHTKYRSQRGGLVARMWQGKCFEEQDETRIALGIYGELLEHPGTSAGMIALKDSALRFRLICLNHEKEHDYKLVEIEATKWLNEAGGRARTSVGMGIQWELCRAQESLGLDRTLSEPQKKNILTQALNRARGINRYPGELKAPSSAMIQRLMLALNREPGDPKDFDSAYGQAGQLYDEVVALNATIQKLVSEKKFTEIPPHQETQKATAGEMARLLNIALRLVKADTDPRFLDLARTRLAYGYLLQGRYLDAACIAEFQMTKYGDTSPETAREAGFLAMTAFDYAYAEAESSDRSFEARKLTEFAEQIAERWPESDRANDARNAVAKIHWNSDDYLEAAQWWERIPQGTSQFADAQIRAGQAYWRKYILSSAMPESERPSSDELTGWKDQAVQHLEAGLSASEAVVADDTPLSNDMVRAKLTLAAIRNLNGDYKTHDGMTGALELLTQPPHALVEEVAVPDGQQRPQDPTSAKSREIASLTYQQLLRTQIGLKDLDAARAAREQLEKVAGAQDSAALTQVFVEFGRELQSELERLQAAGETDRLNEVRAGFEAFLNDLYSRPDGQTFYSMLWIAETYASLGDGSEDSDAKADEFFSKSSSMYKAILERAAGDPLFGVGEQQVLACKLRLVNTLRRQKNFAAGETTILEILKSNPNAPDAQIEAARLYQQWGLGPAPDDWRKLEVALYGTKEPVVVWGWSTASQMLQRALYGKQDEKLEQLHFDARYNLAACEREFGKVHPDDEQAQDHLQRALSAITGFQRLSKRWPDEQYARFNSLYKEIQSDLGNPGGDLPREFHDAEQPIEQTQGVSTAASETPAPEEAVEQPKSQSNILLMLGILALGLAAVGGLFYLTVAQGKKKHDYSASAPARPTQANGEEAASLPAFGNLEIPDEAPSFNFTVEDAPPAFAAVASVAASPKAAKPVAKPASAEGAVKRPEVPGAVDRPRTAKPATPGEASPAPKAARHRPAEAAPGAAPRPAAPPEGQAPVKAPRPRPAEETLGQASKPAPTRAVPKEGVPEQKRAAAAREGTVQKKPAAPKPAEGQAVPKPRPRPPADAEGNPITEQKPRPKKPPESAT